MGSAEFVDVSYIETTAEKPVLTGRATELDQACRS
jgi:hypothetical protein